MMKKLGELCMKKVRAKNNERKVPVGQMRFGVMTQTTKLEIKYRKHTIIQFKHDVQHSNIKSIRKNCKNNQEYAIVGENISTGRQETTVL